MGNVSFWTPLKFEPASETCGQFLIGKIERYFSNGEEAQVRSFQDKTYQVTLKRDISKAPGWGKTALKILSLAFLIPLIALFIKAIYRWTYNVQAMPQEGKMSGGGIIPGAGGGPIAGEDTNSGEEVLSPRQPSRLGEVEKAAERLAKVVDEGVALFQVQENDSLDDADEKIQTWKGSLRDTIQLTSCEKTRDAFSSKNLNSNQLKKFVQTLFSIKMNEAKQDAAFLGIALSSYRNENLQEFFDAFKEEKTLSQIEKSKNLFFVLSKQLILNLIVDNDKELLLENIVQKVTSDLQVLPLEAVVGIAFALFQKNKIKEKDILNFFNNHVDEFSVPNAICLMFYELLKESPDYFDNKDIISYLQENFLLNPKEEEEEENFLSALSGVLLTFIEKKKFEDGKKLFLETLAIETLSNFEIMFFCGNMFISSLLEEGNYQEIYEILNRLTPSRQAVTPSRQAVTPSRQAVNDDICEKAIEYLMEKDGSFVQTLEFFSRIKDRRTSEKILDKLLDKLQEDKLKEMDLSELEKIVSKLSSSIKGNVTRDNWGALLERDVKEKISLCLNHLIWAYLEQGKIENVEQKLEELKSLYTKSSSHDVLCEKIVEKFIGENNLTEARKFANLISISNKSSKKCLLDRIDSFETEKKPLPGEEPLPEEQKEEAPKSSLKDLEAQLEGKEGAASRLSLIQDFFSNQFPISEFNETEAKELLVDENEKNTAFAAFFTKVFEEWASGKPISSEVMRELIKVCKELSSEALREIFSRKNVSSQNFSNAKQWVDFLDGRKYLTKEQKTASYDGLLPGFLNRQKLKNAEDIKPFTEFFKSCSISGIQQGFFQFVTSYGEAQLKSKEDFAQFVIERFEKADWDKFGSTSYFPFAAALAGTALGLVSREELGLEKKDIPGFLEKEVAKITIPQFLSKPKKIEKDLVREIAVKAFEFVFFSLVEEEELASFTHQAYVAWLEPFSLSSSSSFFKDHLLKSMVRFHEERKSYEMAVEFFTQIKIIEAYRFSSLSQNLLRMEKYELVERMIGRLATDYNQWGQADNLSKKLVQAYLKKGEFGKAFSIANQIISKMEQIFSNFAGHRFFLLFGLRGDALNEVFYDLGHSLEKEALETAKKTLEEYLLKVEEPKSQPKEAKISLKDSLRKVFEHGHGSRKSYEVYKESEDFKEIFSKVATF